MVLRDTVGLLDQAQIGLGVGGPNHPEQRFEHRVAGRALGAEPREPRAHPL
jgi:hypothetical protein